LGDVMARFYNDDELNRLKTLEMSILKDFIEICEANDIKYFGLAGTCLGAVRHGGYIPWDDDIDVGLLRADFNRLIEIVERDYSDKYYVLNSERYENYPLMTTRICIKDTKFIEYPLKDVKDCPFGVFLDVFPYDNLADNRVARFFQQWRAWYLSKLMILRNVPEPYLAQTGFLKKVILFICRMVHKTMCFFRINRKKLYRKCLKVCTRYNNRKTKKISFICDTSPHMEEDYYDNVFPCQTIQFEGMDMKFPKDTHLHLTHLYGDTYMTLPPVEKRKTHFPYILDFGDGERIS
jgi:lipopolysaccharide cholinephosphotransferase